MRKLSLDALARELLERAADAAGHRSAESVVGGHERTLRQVVIAMITGSVLAEHANPGEASVYVLRGRVRLAAEGQQWDGLHGDLIVIPDAPHSLEALEDSVVLLTVAKRPGHST